MQKENPGFDTFNFNKQIQSAIVEAGYVTPTAVQQACIPLITAGQEVVGIAPTGTGKTAAYLLPLIKILGYAKIDFPRVLIIVPTHELVIQVENTFNQLAKYTGLRCVSLYGAVGAKKQIEKLNAGADVIVGTHGRVHELYMNGHLILKHVKYFVLDEAEKLMDKNFVPQLHALLEVLPRKRQHLLFSATMSELVQKIMHDFVAFPHIIHIEPENRTATTVSQCVYLTPNLKTKLNLLQHFFNAADNEFHKVIIFCKSKLNATDVYKFFERKLGGGKVKLVHGNKTQQSRMNAMEQFSREQVRVLVTTDVAARGIDILGVTHVINFDTPIIYEDYIHRIGRTGRAFNLGDSITFCSPADEYNLRQIQKLIKQQIEVKDIPAGVFIEETSYEERQAMLREIDFQKRKTNPEFKGAFHEKKAPKKKPYEPKSTQGKRKK